jgi:hypothetical protein
MDNRRNPREKLDNSSMSKPKRKAEDQVKAFRKAARDLGCEDNEERFKEALRAIAKKSPPAKGRKLPASED